jgi:hypothetical protein
MKCLIGLLPILIPLALASRSAYCFNVSLGWDVLLSAYTGGRPGESLSGRAGTAQRQGKLRGRIFAPIINFIMRNPTHCLRAIDGDIARAKAVILDDSKQP